VELTFIDVDHLLTSFHQFDDFSHRRKLLLLDLFLLLHLATVCKLRLTVSDLVFLVDFSDSIVRDFDSVNLLNQDRSLFKRVRSPVKEGLRVDHEGCYIRCQLGMLVLSKLALVDYLASISYPPSAYVVSSCVVDIGDLRYLLEGHLDLSWFIHLTVSQEDNECLHLKVDFLEERRSLDLVRLLLFLVLVLMLSKLL